MLNRDLEPRQAGKFAITPDREVYGELTLAGAKTSLHLHDKEFFWTKEARHLKGVLLDLTKVTLVHCITAGPGRGTRGGGQYHFAEVFPHFVVYGDHHINPEEKTIIEVHFVIDDATAIFYDFDAFGTVIDAKPYIEEIVKANKVDREIPIGDNPLIQYFTGKHEIFTSETAIGKISASHRMSISLGGPKGVQLKNTIVITTAFNEPVNFEDAITHVITMLSYCGLLVGRPQNILKLSLRILSDAETPAILGVYWSMPPKRKRNVHDAKPHPGDVLLDGARQPEQFSRVLASWLGRQGTWRDARGRFVGSFAKQHRYTIERLIGSANMFDILPSAAVPSDVPLSEDMKLAQSEARRIFRALPASPERDSILGALGRLGKSSLKRKIRYRAQSLIDAVGEKFPDLDLVVDEAVNCRNYYVHGGDARFDYVAYFDSVVFFIDTLEFVFGASDLVESGWDIKAWSETPTGMSHPFGRYRVNYMESLSNLRAHLKRPERN